MTPAGKPRPRVRAFTLLELVVATSVMAILATGIGSVFVLAARALPNARGPSETSITATTALDQLTADLRVATSITAASATSITFTVPDRTGDGVDDTITYSWAGAGSPIIRQFDGDGGSPILASAANFAIGYNKRTVSSTTTTTTSQDSGEVLLSSFAGWSGITPTTMNGGLSTTGWSSEAFTVDKITIPSDSTKWYVSRVSLRVGHTVISTSGVVVSIWKPAGPGNPIAGTQVGSSYTIASGLLSSVMNWQDSTFSDVTFTDPTATSLVIVCKGTSTGGQIEYLNSSSAPTDAYTYLSSTNSGSTWTPTTNLNRNDAKFFVYGGYVHQVQTTVSVNLYYLGSVTVTLQPTADASTRIDTGFALMNQPQVPGP
jgi:prepilin-type N-terminal cleavage/methylation domain-containing protein